MCAVATSFKSMRRFKIAVNLTARYHLCVVGSELARARLVVVSREVTHVLESPSSASMQYLTLTMADGLVRLPLFRACQATRSSMQPAETARKHSWIPLRAVRVMQPDVSSAVTCQHGQT